MLKVGIILLLKAWIFRATSQMDFGKVIKKCLDW